jgi:lysyl-tRNA synthetase class 2
LLASATHDRVRAAALVRRHGTDTLSAFKLRSDLYRRWSPDGRAFAAYRVESGTLLAAGDPVGPDESRVAVLDRLKGDAARHGLAMAVVGASESFAMTARAQGLRRIYLGDEAIIAAGEMDLSGRPKKNLRNAVRRVKRHGYGAELHEIGHLTPSVLDEMRLVSERWLGAAPERGFSMAHDTLVDELLPDALVVLARDGAGRLGGFLLFVPVFGRPVVSLAFMRRDRETPNGLMEFLVVQSAQLLGARGIEAFSLNFSAFGRFLRAPANRLERLLGSILRTADRWFQIQRLLRFNAKFQPQWRPRYLLFDRPGQLPRIALAALTAEGQLPRFPNPSLILRTRLTATIRAWSSPSPATSDIRSSPA